MCVCVYVCVLMYVCMYVYLLQIHSAIPAQTKMANECLQNAVEYPVFPERSKLANHRSMIIGEGGQYLYVGGCSPDWNIHVYAVSTGGAYGSGTLLAYQRRFMINHPTGDMLFTFTVDGKVNVWDLNSEQIVASRNLVNDLKDDNTNHKQLSVLPTPAGDAFFTFGSKLRSFHMHVASGRGDRSEAEAKV